MLLPHGKFLGQPIDGAELSGLRWKTSSYAPRQELQKHSHETANFCLVVRGNFVDRRNHIDACLNAGSVVFWAAGVPHAQRFGADGGTCFNLAFPTDWLREYDADFDFGDTHFDVRPHLAALCRALYRECQHRDAFSTLAIEGLALQLLAEFSRVQHQHDVSDAPGWLMRVVEIIDARLSERLTMERLAQEVDVDAARLSRVFQRVRGMSVVDYIQHKRIERACGALLDTCDSVSAIAIRLGFFDQSHLTRIFRKITGMTPGAYREKHRLSKKVL